LIPGAILAVMQRLFGGALEDAGAADPMVKEHVDLMV
jgi:hypothetical protein